MKSIHPLLVYFIALAIGLQVGCSSETDSEIQTVNENLQETPEMAHRADKVRRILYSVPSHIEMIRLIQDANIQFSIEVLNAPNKVANYNSIKSQAFNLGVYGTDLAYISVFEQSQEVLNYLAAVKGLSDQLGVSEIINDDNIKRFEKNVENQDSLVLFISEVFYSIDETLNESDRGYVSAIVVAGGWIEAMHIMTNSNDAMQGPFKDRLKTIIADQRHSLENIRALIEIYDNEENLGDLLQQFETLKGLFDELIVEDNKTTVTKEESGKVIIGGKDKVTFSDELLDRIEDEITVIRNNYIN